MKVKTTSKPCVKTIAEFIINNKKSMLIGRKKKAS